MLLRKPLAEYGQSTTQDTHYSRSTTDVTTTHCCFVSEGGSLKECNSSASFPAFLSVFIFYQSKSQ